MRERLLAAVIPLEAIPDSEKDWHPGSNGFILNLAHPSLYPIVYGRTMGKPPGSDTTTILQPPEFKGVNPNYVSKRFQCIPSDFSVGDDGRVTLTSSYINNIHPTRHKELYSVIPEILQHAIPMFERVLSDLIRPLLPMRIATSGRPGVGGDETANCIWENGIPYPSPSNEHEFNQHKDGWYAPYRFKTPDARDMYDGDLQVMNDRICLSGRTLQIIVSLANTVLTPERPEYPGGKWHVEGLSRSRFVQKGSSGKTRLSFCGILILTVLECQLTT